METAPSREELIQSIQPGMRLTKALFMRVYCYEITTPGFAAVALEKLEGLYLLYGQVEYSKAREYYRQLVGEYEKQHNEELKSAAEWYVKQLNDRRERTVRKTVAGGRQARRYQFAGFPEDW